MVLDEKNFVDKAEKSILSLINNSEKDKWGNSKIVTNSKIRNLLAMTADIYNEVLISNEKLSNEVNARIDYLRVRFVYECGRDTMVKDFVEKADILNALKEINGSRKNFILFQHYMEALVAFHKYNHKERD
ncbi:MAG: type III-A CRISPR-associated protein Csm2 [Clostridium sp.]|nr:type III-A CRISPR-associated protein Csm2 [Clostridium sp.]